MKNYTIAEQFALIALNAQDSKHDTAAKKITVMGIAAAESIQDFLLEAEDKALEEVSGQLKNQMARIKKMSRKDRRKIEKEYADMLKTENVLEEIPDLLGCDIDYYTASVTMREYKSKEDIYSRITEELRAVILEPGEVTDETVILLWLCRESGCIHDIFSVKEQDEIQKRFIDLASENAMYRLILEQEFHSVLRLSIVNFLKWKRNLFKNPHLEGINLLFPFLDRRQAIFIDMVILGTTVADRRQTAIQFLRDNGHSCEEIKSGTETIVKVDNGYYRIFPSSRVSKLPIQGIELLPVYR